MSLPSKPITVRLTADQMRVFMVLTQQFGGLSPSLVLRMLIGAQLQRPLVEQIAVIHAQIRCQGHPASPVDMPSDGRGAKRRAGPADDGDLK